MTCQLIQGDCLVELKKLNDKSIDFVYLDLPYGQTGCAWDVKLDHHALWVELKRIAKSDRTPFFFSCTTKFGFELFNTAPKGYFRWDLVWEKNRAAGFLNAYKLPMRKHEMIYCFAKKTPGYDVNSHLTGETLNKTRGSDIYVQEALGDKLINNTYKSKELKEPLPTSVLPPQDESDCLNYVISNTTSNVPKTDHESVYCFAKKSPDYHISDHFTGDLKEKPASRKNQNLMELMSGCEWENFNQPYQYKVTKKKLPTTVIPPQEDHDLVYCFAKKTPEYDVSSHSEYKQDKSVSKGAFEVYGKELNENKAKRHKDPLPTSVLPPQEESDYTYEPRANHELVYCFAKKTPVYDVSSHSEYVEDKNGRPITTPVYGKENNTKKIKAKTHKDPLPTSVLPPQEIPSSWCKYKLDEKVNHRTSKPVKLMEFLLKYWSKEGDTVLDPTAGSGSMGLACKNMNRNFIGIEKDEEIFQIMKDRIENHKVETAEKHQVPKEDEKPPCKSQEVAH